jgi:putative ABC transport system permease protein
MEIEGQPPATKESEKTALPLRAVTEDYFKLGVGMLGGREFRSSDEGKRPSVAIVNQGAVQFTTIPDSGARRMN